MARYEHLPIYKAALDAAVHFEKVVAGFSRYHKYTLGTELRNASREAVEQVIRANAARNRAPELIRLRDQLERVLVLLRLAKEVKAFNLMHAPRFSALRWPIGSDFYPPTGRRSGRHCGLPAVPAASVSRRLVFPA